MHVVSENAIVADIAAELELSPAEASLYLSDLLNASDEYESSEFDS